MKRRCEICWDEPEAKNDYLCKRCGKDYDKHAVDLESMREMLTWAARRARRFERARAKAESLRAMKEDRP